MLVKLFMDLIHTVKSKKGGFHYSFQAGVGSFFSITYTVSSFSTVSTLSLKSSFSVTTVLSAGSIMSPHSLSSFFFIRLGIGFLPSIPTIFVLALGTC